MRLARNRRRALSTIVSTTILLTAVVAIGTGVVAWSNTSLRTYESNLSSSASDKTNKINEMLTIENIVFIPSPLELNITVTNIGTLAVNVTQIQISDPSPRMLVQTVSHCISPNCSGNIIYPHSSQWFLIPYTWTSNTATTIAVTTLRGTIITTQGMHQ